jgi:hypothetical protein
MSKLSDRHLRRQVIALKSHVTGLT